MKRLARVLVLVLGLAPLLITNVALATPIVFVATLLGSNEIPSVSSMGIGSAIVTIDPAAHFLEVNVTFSGLTGLTTAAHIHCCAPQPANVGVATATPTFPGFPLGVTSGTYDMIFDTSLASTWNPNFIVAHGGTVPGAEAAFFAGMLAGQSYLNIHTNLFPTGEIRGVLLVPEPATLALFSAALLALGFVRRRKQN